MAYDLLLPFRKLALEIPNEVLNSTHRLIVKTFIEYHSPDKGVYVSNKTLAKEMGLAVRTLAENLHYLGDGQVWKKGKRIACANTKCKSHLGIITGTHYARVGKSQIYRIHFDKIEALASMRTTAPSSLDSEMASMRLDVIEHAVESELACDSPHPYIPDIPDIRKATYLKKVEVNTQRWHLISQELPKLLTRQWNHTEESEKLLDVILQETSFKAFVSELRAINFDTLNDMSGYFMSWIRLRAGGKKVTSNSFKTTWCGKCDEVTRSYPEMSAGVDDKDTYECPKCHPNQVRIKNLLETRANSSLDLANLFHGVSEI
jgi:hypothetical protein